MEGFVRNFIRASLAWLGIGVSIGVSMVFWPAEALVFRTAHLHANLLGFVSMMIFGIAYHVIPRFSGRPLPSRRLPRLHWWLANVGLALLVGGWMLRPAVPDVGGILLGAGAIGSAAGALIFILVIWRTLHTGLPQRAAWPNT